MVPSLSPKENSHTKQEVEEIIADDKKFTKHANELLVYFVHVIRIAWEEEALRCFGEEWGNLIGLKIDSASVVISDDKNRIAIELIPFGKDEFPRINSMLTEIKKQVSLHWEKYQDDSEDINYMNVLSYLVLLHLFSIFSDTQMHSKFRGGIPPRDRSIGVKTHYLPAVRGGLMQSHRILVSAIVDRAPTIGLTGVEIIPFTGVLADFLQKLINIDSDHSGFVSRKRRSRDTEKVSKLSQEIEQKIIQGKIKIKRSATSYPNFRYQFDDKNKDTQDISLINASSSVSELAPIVLFIRYYLSPGDIFIVEEPEAHLHPGAQRIIAGVLVELVNAGVQVIVTTHSDIMLEQISNFIHADKIPQAKILNKKAKGRTLSEDKSGIYWFKGSASGNKTVVRTVECDEQTGILTKDHLAVSSDLYNETVDLLNIRERNAEMGENK